MPTYQYACTECGERLEVVQRFSDDPLTECPNCHGRLRKLFSPVGVVFKGSGFYKTDSRSSTKPAAKTSPSTESSSSPESSSTKESSGGSGEAAGTSGSTSSTGSGGSSADGSKVA